MGLMIAKLVNITPISLWFMVSICSITIVHGANLKQLITGGTTLWNWLEIGGKILGSDMNYIMIYCIMISYRRGGTDYDIVDALFLFAFNSYCFLIPSGNLT